MNHPSWPSDYFATVELLHRTHQPTHVLGDLPAHPIRIGQPAHIGFEGHEVHSVETTSDGYRVQLRTHGLLGPSSPMPSSFVSTVARSARVNDDHSLADLVNWVQAEPLALLYGAWVSSRPSRRWSIDHGDRYRRLTGAVGGAREIPSSAHARLAARAGRLRSAGRLESVLKHQLGERTVVRTICPHRGPVANAFRWQMGASQVLGRIELQSHRLRTGPRVEVDVYAQDLSIVGRLQNIDDELGMGVRAAVAEQIPAPWLCVLSVYPQQQRPWVLSRSPVRLGIDTRLNASDPAPVRLCLRSSEVCARAES